MKIETSNGDLVDKITILLIKTEKIKDPIKNKNCRKELNLLLLELENLIFKDKEKLMKELKEINSILWEIEEELRIKEKNQEFDNDFIQLARRVYITNDKRADIKRKINEFSNSLIIEEKEYIKY